MSVSAVSVQVHPDELTLLRGFSALVSEWLGYVMGVEALNAQMNADPEIIKVRAALSEKRGQIKGDNLISLIERGDVETYRKISAEIKLLEKTERQLKKPWEERKKPLKAASTLLKGYVITSLTQLGIPPSPRFSLSDWVVKELAKEGKGKRKKEAQQ